MVSICLLGLFAWGFYKGYRRGFALQIIYLLGFISSYAIATFFYKDLAKLLELIIPFPKAQADTKLSFFSESQTLDMDTAFYAGVAFLLIYFICYFLMRLLAMFVYGLRFIPLLGNANKMVGGISGFLSIFLTSFMIIKLLSMLPIDSVQAMISNDLLVNAMLERIPFFSNNLQNLWVTQIIG